MNQKMFFSLTFLALCSCGNRNLEDYNREKAHRDEQRIQSAVGSYRGEMVNSRSREVLGLIQVDLHPDRLINVESQSETSALKASLLFSGKSPTYLNSSRTYYDWEAGRVNAEFSVPGSKQTSTIILRMDAKFTSGKLKGSIESLGFEKDSAEFELTKEKRDENSKSFFRSGQTSKSLNGKDEIELVYSGLLDGNEGDTSASKISLMITNSDSDPALKFAELLAPQKTVRAVMAISRNDPPRRQGRLRDGFSVNFTNGVWDPSLGTLQADYQSQNPMDRNHFSLRCSGRYVENEETPSELNCRYQSSERGITLDMSLRMEGSLK